MTYESLQDVTEERDRLRERLAFLLDERQQLAAGLDRAVEGQQQLREQILALEAEVERLLRCLRETAVAPIEASRREEP